jgi:hypothetical protein
VAKSLLCLRENGFEVCLGSRSVAVREGERLADGDFLGQGSMPFF